MREAVPVVTDERTDAVPAFEEYVVARSRALWRSAWLLTGDRHRAEDLVQTALMKCRRRWGQDRGRRRGRCLRATKQPSRTARV
ncbi:MULTISPECIES: hypothetical protein [Nocardioides]|uniref:RNA polymerase sigma-70 region 2 domain-containing protein n=1 Tax=Nocardioides vastitatis TaxID=2568655 RepID=A0ABW0ZF39_9ACTN|nr:hypothetical protein [Nocardioides sp.]THI96906.1 hypothetical protein E7Z54_15525 [Nocardioides sp.]